LRISNFEFEKPDDEHCLRKTKSAIRNPKSEI